MERYAILLGYCDKQMLLICKLCNEIRNVDLTIYDKRFFFAMKSQQFYTAIEDLFKQIAKSFENHIDNMGSFHKEILIRMNTAVPSIRPKVITDSTLGFLDKLRAFRHFIRHAYDCELNLDELILIQKRITKDFSLFQKDMEYFYEYLRKLVL